jgi:hypothetical protein
MPLYPVTTQAQLSLQWCASSPKEATDLAKTETGLSFTVVTTDSPPKDVIVGKIMSKRAV